MLQKFLLQFFLSYAVFVHLFVRSGSPTVKDLPNSVFWSGISVWNNPVGLIITWGLFMHLQGPDYAVVKIMIILRIVVSICWTFWATEAKRFFNDYIEKEWHKMNTNKYNKMLSQGHQVCINNALQNTIGYRDHCNPPLISKLFYHPCIHLSLSFLLNPPSPPPSTGPLKNHPLITFAFVGGPIKQIKSYCICEEGLQRVRKRLFIILSGCLSQGGT